MESINELLKVFTRRSETEVALLKDVERRGSQRVDRGQRDKPVTKFGRDSLSKEIKNHGA